MPATGDRAQSGVACLKILHTITIIYLIVRFPIIFNMQCTSLCLIGIGSYLIHSFRSNTYSQEASFPTIPLILLVVGFVTILVCILGLYGSKNDNLCMLRTVCGTSILLTCYSMPVSRAFYSLSSSVLPLLQSS